MNINAPELELYRLTDTHNGLFRQAMANRRRYVLWFGLAKALLWLGLAGSARQAAAQAQARLTANDEIIRRMVANTLRMKELRDAS